VKYFARNKWHAATAETFLQNDETGLPTIIFIHGNRYTSADAVNSGWEAYYALTKGMPAHRQIRFVVWSWPSAQDSGLIRDVREKSARTLVEGYYLSRLLHRMQPTVQTGIVGYSFGSRIALGAVHLTAGGQLEGRTVPEPQPEVAAMYRVAMLAPGVEDYGLVPGARFDLAIHRIDRLLNLYNPADPALKRYRFVSKSERPTAMGYSGIVGESRLGDASARITECNVSGIIGKTHNEDPYFASERVMSQVRNTVLGGMHVDKAAELSQN
jgi:hypothetical protein